ncbi:TPA: hypothetical protein EYN98_02825 [Candidatus Poribacteria bacterium]|nr:hypothetical protein [Candidatus Poribacteria bacterium]HIC01237.1 hypothetical protein [Candidatus Poribacteria bacterium]HIN29165.1 hypothetical protein [Candidatus Poribacteria bacterium]
MTDQRQKPITAFLLNSSEIVFVFYAIFVSFSTYFCMYAFRKPFAAATFAGLQFFGTTIKLKKAIVISQIIGYALSKYAGIKICSEISPKKRLFTLVFLILFAESALIIYGILPNNYKVFAIFLNGIPLGMVWGLVVWYLEGRQTSELLLAGLSCSFILASGIVKDFGRAVMGGVVAEWWLKIPLLGTIISRLMGEVSEGWMPAVVGLHFLPFFFISVWLLNQLPQPTEADIEARTERETMDGSERLSFLKHFLLGIILLCVAYFFLTAYRDYRDNYQVEIFNELGYVYEDNKTIITQAETIVAFGVICALALIYLIKDNRLGLIGAYGIMVSGIVLMGISTTLLDAKIIDGFWWMTLVGLGAYLTYVPYGSVLFDRLIAHTKYIGTAVFAIYVADAIGYTGSISVQLYEDFFASDKIGVLAFFRTLTYLMSIVGAFCLLGSCFYFLNRGDDTVIGGAKDE